MTQKQIDAAALAIVNKIREINHFGPLSIIEELLLEDEPNYYRQLARAALLAAEFTREPR